MGRATNRQRFMDLLTATGEWNGNNITHKPEEMRNEPGVSSIGPRPPESALSNVLGGQFRLNSMRWGLLAVWQACCLSSRRAESRRIHATCKSLS